MARKWWTLTAVVIGVFMLLLDVTIVNVALPDIERQLHASLSDVQWVIDAYALALATLLLTAGSLADLLGRRRVFAVGIAIFILGSFLCGVAGSALVLSLSRAFQGIGGAVMFATALALLADAFRGGRDRGVAFGAFGAVAGIAVAVGPVLGGAITSGLSWRWIFFVNVPVGLAAIAITLLRVEESRDPAARRPDWPGFATFSVGLAAFVYGLIKSSADGWGSDLVVGCLVTSGVLIAAFLAIEVRRREPMFDLDLLGKPTFVGGLTSAFAISASLFSLLTFIVLYFQNILGYSAIGTGLRLLALTGAIFLSAGIAGRLSSRVPVRLLIGPGFVLVGAGLLLMRGISVGSDWTHLLPGLIVAGLGAGMVTVPLASTAVGVVHHTRAGMASGVNNTFRQVGVAAGVAALGSIFASHVRDRVVSGLASTPLADHSHRVALEVSTGHATQAIAAAPAAARAQLGAVSQSSFVDGLNLILLIAAVAAFAAAALALALIRQRDFVDSSEDAGMGIEEGVPTGPRAERAAA
jgi:EmrB/QacA subfamily drug resistance transporter